MQGFSRTAALGLLWMTPMLAGCPPGFEPDGSARQRPSAAPSSSYYERQSNNGAYEPRPAAQPLPAVLPPGSYEVFPPRNAVRAPVAASDPQRYQVARSYATAAPSPYPDRSYPPSVQYSTQYAQYSQYPPGAAPAPEPGSAPAEPFVERSTPVQRRLLRYPPSEHTVMVPVDNPAARMPPPTTGEGQGYTERFPRRDSSGYPVPRVSTAGGRRVIYVPAHVRIPDSSSSSARLGVVLRIHNLDSRHEVTVYSVDYYASNGDRVHRYVKEPLRLPPLGSQEFRVDLLDAQRGPGSNFIIEWVAGEDTQPMSAEAVMSGQAESGFVSFTNRGFELLDGAARDR